MLRWHSAPVLALSGLFAALSLAAPSSQGPTSPVEAEILWKDGKTAFEAGKFQDCINHLQRFVDRYPGAAGYHEARRFLGECYLGMGEVDKALPPLKDFVQAAKDPKDAALGKLALARAYLETRKYQEAFLLSREFEAASLDREPILRGRGLLIKALASLGQNHDDRALRALEAARKTLGGHETSAVAGEALITELKVRSRVCARMPVAEGMDEAQAREQLKRRGLCLNEVLVTYKNGLQDTTETAIKAATLEMLSAFREFAVACTHPPDPQSLKPKDRSATQRKAYQEELASVLKQDCTETFQTAAKTLTEAEAPKGSPVLRQPLYPVAVEQLKNFSLTLAKIAKDRLTTQGGHP